MIFAQKQTLWDAALEATDEEVRVLQNLRESPGRWLRP